MMGHEDEVDMNSEQDIIQRIDDLLDLGKVGYNNK